MRGNELSEAESFSHLIVIGSSAGGIEALTELVQILPADLATPIAIAQHLEPERVSHLKEILSRWSTLPVRTVTEHAPLEAGVVFVVPANRHVNITEHEIDLTFNPRGRPMPSIDLLFGSAARIFGGRLIAVILTGTGSDGTEGARIVSQAGGTVIVQDPQTAKHGDMPGSLAPNTVDIVADLEKIGPILGRLTSNVEEPEIGQFVERRRAETERDRSLSREREARRELSGILESISDAFFAVDREWRFTYVNREAEELWSRSRVDLRGKNLWEEFP